jgi:hypothetical protein
LGRWPVLVLTGHGVVWRRQVNMPRDYACADCKHLVAAYEPKVRDEAGWHHVRCVPGSAKSKQSRCCECDFLIDAGMPRIATVFGWAHPVCVPGGDAA